MRTFAATVAVIAIGLAYTVAHHIAETVRPPCGRGWLRE